MKYDVLVSFTDAKDVSAPAGATIYWAGKSQYPRDGHTPTKAHIEYLLGDKNRFRKPVIAAKMAIETTMED